MNWAALVVPTLITTAVTFIPGLVITVIAGLRGVRALAVAPLVSIALISVAGILGPPLGLRWGVVPVVALTIPAAGVALLVRRWAHDPPDVHSLSGWRGRDNLAGYASVILALVLWLRHLVAMLGRPDAFSQTFDNIYHLNAIRFILDTGDSSSLHLGQLGGTESVVSFYPGAWHNTISLVMTLGVDSMPLAINALIVVTAGLIWPLACIFLVTTLFRCHPATTLTVGVLSASYANFPIMLLDFGVLYPNFLGLAQLPVLMGFAAHLFRVTETQHEPALVTLFLGAIALPGVALSHPNVVFTLAALVSPMILTRMVRQIRAAQRSELPRSTALVQSIGLALLLVGMASMWFMIKAGDWTWAPVNTSATSVGEFVLNNAMGRPPAWFLAVLLLVGGIAIVRTGRFVWLLFSALAAVFLWVVASVWVIGPLRQFITGAWYNDPYRLGAALPIAALPIAVLGLQWLVEQIQLRNQREGALQGDIRTREALLLGGVTVLATVSTQITEPMTWAVEHASWSYDMNEDSALITPEEYEMLTSLSDLTEPGSVVVTNVWNGSSLAYAFGERRSTSLAPFVNPSEEVLVLNESLSSGEEDPDLCPALLSTSADYVLDFGDREVHGGSHVFPGLEDLDTSDAVRLVHEVGEARLYEIVACE